MKKGWTTRRLGDICTTIQDGAHESPKKQFDTPAEGRFLYITSKNIRTNYLDLDGVSYVEQSFHDRIYPRCQPQVGDVLLTKDGANTGNVSLNTITEPFSLLSSVCLIKTNPAALQPAFLCYYIQSPDGLKSITGQMTGAAIKRIILRDIKLATIPVPPLHEQQRIVGILDDAFEGIATAKANAEKNLQNARALFESHLQSVFTQRGPGWVERRLWHACEIIMGQSPDGESYNSTGEGMPLINGPVEFSPDSFGRTVRSKFTTQPTKLCKKDDLILCVRGSTTGRMNIAGFDACIGRGVAAIRAKEYQPWINYFVSAKREDIYRLGTGATFPNVSGSILGELKLSVPALATQRDIVAKLDGLRAETQRLASLYNRKLAALEALKKSMLHQAFTGEL